MKTTCELKQKQKVQDSTIYKISKERERERERESQI